MITTGMYLVQRQYYLQAEISVCKAAYLKTFNQELRDEYTKRIVQLERSLLNILIMLNEPPVIKEKPKRKWWKF